MNYNGAIEYRKPNDAPKTKPWPCVKTMLCDGEAESVWQFDFDANDSMFG